MHKLILTWLLLLGTMYNLYAQDTRFEYSDTSLIKKDPLIEKNIIDGSTDYEDERDILSDTTLYIVRVAISPDSIRSWKNDKRFAHLKNLDSILKAEQKKDLSNVKTQPKPSRSFLERVLSSPITEIVFWTVAIGIVLLILFKLFFSGGIFKGSTASSAVNLVEEEEKIETVSDYDKLIHQSCKLGDFRMAVRYLFLKTLVALSDKEYIQRSVDKTNYQYVQEIRADKKNDFASLVLTYDYVWYGNFPVSQESFGGIEKKFISFNNKI